MGIDFSALPFEQNVSRTKEAVEAVKAINLAILVEGEIGDIGTGSEIQETAQVELRTSQHLRKRENSSTQRELMFSLRRSATCTAWLTVWCKGETKKHLDVERIAQIKKAAAVFLTLHGGSGTDDEDFLKPIAAGINIIHINTELRIAWRRSLGDSRAQDPNQVVPYRILPPVIDSVKHVVSSRLKLFSFPPLS